MTCHSRYASGHEVGRSPEYPRKQIMQVVKKVFARDGHDKANSEMIRKKAGIGRGTIRRDFKNKKSIFDVIREEEFVKPYVSLIRAEETQVHS